MILLNKLLEKLELWSGFATISPINLGSQKSASQQLGDFAQKTGGNLMILLNRLLVKLEFGQRHSQQSFQPWKPESASQQLGDFAQKTGEF